MFARSQPWQSMARLEKETIYCQKIIQFREMTTFLWLIHRSDSCLALYRVFGPRGVMTDIVVASSPNPAVNTERLFIGGDGSWVSGDSVVRDSHGLRYRRLVTVMLGKKTHT